jgi:putative membrane protein
VKPRFPKGVFDGGDEPDARFTLANERTFLAWVRTSLALVAGAVAIHTPALDLDRWIETAASLSLLSAAGIAIGQAWWRWRATERALRTGQPLPGFGGPLLMAGVVCVLIVGATVGVIVVAVR